MKKVLLFLIVTTTLFATCTVQQKAEALKIWRESIHKDGDLNQKLQLLNQADKICPNLEVVYIDRGIVIAGVQPTLLLLQTLKDRNNLLVLKGDAGHKWNSAKKIEQLFLNYYKNQKRQAQSQKGFGGKDMAVIDENIRRLSNYSSENTVKAVTSIGGSFEADLLFSQGANTITNHDLTQEIVQTIHNEVQLDNLAIFGLEGGASSEGNYLNNQRISKRRAEALKGAILKQYPNYENNLKLFVLGESQLVCGGGLLPEKNSRGEYRCLTQEDRIKSRRVVIRRVQ